MGSATCESEFIQILRVWTLSWAAAPLCAPRAAGPNLPILAPGLRGCPGRASGGLDTWGPIFGGKSGFRALSPRAQRRTYSGALSGEDPLARYRARSGREVPAQSISEIVEKTGTLGDSYWTPISTFWPYPYI